jgi:hypothetical protein
VRVYGEVNDAGGRKPSGWPLADPTLTARQTVKRPTWIRLRDEEEGGGESRKSGSLARAPDPGVSGRRRRGGRDVYARVCISRLVAVLLQRGFVGQRRRVSSCCRLQPAAWDVEVWVLKGRLQGDLCKASVPTPSPQRTNPSVPAQSDQCPAMVSPCTFHFASKYCSQ